MNDLMAAMFEKYNTKMNPNVMEGITVLHMKRSGDYLHNVFLGLNRSYEAHNLRYVSWEFCTPEEEYNEATKMRNNKRTFDLAETDFVLLKFMFEHLDRVSGIWKPLGPRYIYVPFVREAGLMYISGSLYHLSPVSSDQVISPDLSFIFVRLLSNKIKFYRTYHPVMVNGVRQSAQICWAPVYRKPQEKRKIPPTTKALTSTAHYLFARFGFKEAFTRYAGHVPMIGQGEMNSSTHPSSEWVLCESSSTMSHVKPRTFIGEYYRPTNIQLAIPKDKYTPQMASLVEGFFYVVDHFPDRLKAEYLESKETWMILLGHIIFSGHFGENKLYTQIQEHFGSLEMSVDKIIIEKLASIGCQVNDFFDLIAYISGNWNNLVAKRSQSNLSMYDKTLETLYHVMYPITESINKTNFKLNKYAQKKPLSRDDIVEIFNRTLRVRAAFDLCSDSIVTESVSYSGDHMYPKITSKLTNQEDYTGQGGGRKKRLVIGPDQHLDTSQIEHGSVLYLSKSNPSPATKLNPYSHIDMESSRLIRNPELIPVLTETQRLYDKK